MNKKIIIGIVAIVCIVAVALVYLASSGGKLSDISLPDLTPPSQEDLYGSWRFSDMLVQDPISGELKSDPKAVTGVGKYLEFKSDGRACSNGYLDEKGFPKPCEEWGTYQVNGDTMTLQGSGAPDFSIKWDIKEGKLELIIDVSAEAPVSQDSGQPQPTKMILILTKITL